ncbi:MAG: ribbon-helix-helix domain-containing protein [Rhizomicrobium sp.]|nr:ribbon-helix-helix domain-containing protein [Rhizomicrobium sp.]
MNFNLYLDDQTAKDLDQTAEEMGESRSGLIRKAVREWLDKKALGNPGWPRSVLEWNESAEIAPFESHRDELVAPSEELLA